MGPERVEGELEGGPEGIKGNLRASRGHEAIKEGSEGVEGAPDGVKGDLRESRGDLRGAGVEGDLRESMGN